MLFTKEYFDLGGAVYHHARVDELPHEKENALVIYLSMTCRSWTFARMTQKERERCMDAFLWASEQGLLKGNFMARWNTMQAIYNAFLAGLGYTAFGWREPDKQDQTGENAA